MTTLIGFLQQPLVHGIARALGWTLLHFCWQGALVAGLLWCVLALVGGRAVRLRYGLACAGLLLMAVLPLMTMARLAANETRNALPVTLPAFTLNVSADGMGNGSESLGERLAHGLDAAAPWIPAVWAVGLFVFLGRLNYGLVVAGRLKSSGTEPVSSELLENFEALKKRLGVKDAVRLLQSTMVQVPTVIGWLRPIVLVPVGCFMGLSPVQVEALLAHELAHIGRHDYLVNVLQSVVEGLLFYHPAVWWVSRQVRRERECCCDELAVGVGGDALAYARALACLEESRAGMPEVVLNANGGILTMRIKRLLGSGEESVMSRAMAGLILSVVVVVATLYVAAAARAQSHRMAAIAGVYDEPLIATEIQSEIAQVPPAAPYEPGRRKLPGALAANIVAIAGGSQAQGNIAQGETAGVISGVVYDPTGALVPRAQVKATNAGTNLVRGGVSDDAGNYSLTALPPGTYTVDVRAAGFAPVKRENVRVEMGRATGVNLKLSVGSVNETLAVKSEAAVEMAKAEGPVPPPPPPASGRPARVSAGVMAGNAILQPAPVYPVEAKAARVQGVVVLHAVISKTGDVKDLAVVSGPPELMVSSIDAVRQWKYKPYLLNGEPTAVETTININYTFGDDNNAPAAQKGAEGASAPLRASAVAMEGNLLTKVPPIYPSLAKAAGIQGAVVLHAIISKTGTVERLTVVSGPRELNTSALDAVRQWKYKPYLLNGEPTEVETTITVNYSLQEDGGASPQGGMAKMSDGATAPIIIYKVNPEYTKQARKAKKSGVVVVKLIVNQEGLPAQVHVVKSLDKGLDKQAVDAVKQYRFKPAMKDNKPVEEALNVEVNFQIF